MARPSPKSKLVKTLRRLQKERDPLLRSRLIEMGRKALLNWFAMGARNLLRGVLPVNKVTQRFIQAHRQELSTIADKHADEGERKKAILKRGGAGFLGGTIIRHLFKWETQKKKRVPPLRIRVPRPTPTGSPVHQTPDQTPLRVSPLRIRLKKKKSPKRKSPQRKSPKRQKLIVKFPFGKKKKKRSPKKSPKRSPKTPKKVVVRIPLEKVRNPSPIKTPVKKTKTLADLKLGLAQKKMERAMRGPIGSSRTNDIAVGNVMPFTPLTASTPKPPAKSPHTYRCGVDGKEFSSLSHLFQHMNTRHVKGDKPKYVCTFCGIQYNLQSSLYRHIETVHQGKWPRRLLN